MMLRYTLKSIYISSSYTYNYASHYITSSSSIYNTFKRHLNFNNYINNNLSIIHHENVQKYISLSHYPNSYTHAFHLIRHVSTSLYEETLIDDMKLNLSEENDEKISEKNQKSLQIGILGIPNAGKSELTNRLVGHKITAVSSKENTTVSPRLGAYVEDDTQVILYDLPGVIRQKDIRYKGQMERVENAWITAVDCDMILFIVDANELIKHLFNNENTAETDTNTSNNISTLEMNDDTITNNISSGDMRKKSGNILNDKRCLRTSAVFKLTEQLSDGIQMQNGKVLKYPSPVLLLNKIDLIPKEDKDKIVTLAEKFYNLCYFKKCFFISALKGTGIQNLKKYFKKQAKNEAWLLPSGQSTDMAIQEMALELVREKLYKRLNQELPYELKPLLNDYSITPSGNVYINIFLYVKNANTRKIVVGKKGNVIQDYVVEKTKKELEKMYQRNVTLRINVKIR